MKTERIEDYKPILIECYSSDPTLTERWHTVVGLDQCVEKEFADLQHAKVEFIKVIDGDQLAGYFCKELFEGEEFLTGFFLMPSYRTKEMKSKYWDLIKSKFKSPFFCGLYENNIPANKFVTNRGAKLLAQVQLPDGLANYFKVGA